MNTTWSAPDGSREANPRGMAIKFDLPGGGTYDIVAHSFNGFPVATAAEFSELLQALPLSGPGAAKPTPPDRFFAGRARARDGPGSGPAGLLRVVRPDRRARRQGRRSQCFR